MWTPELSASVVILDAAPPGYDDTEPIEPASLGRVLADRVLSDGRHLVIGDDGGPHRVWVRDPTPGRRLAFVLPRDSRLALRETFAQRLHRRLTGLVGGPPPAGCRPTDFQRQRLALLLALNDAEGAGATRQEMARLVYRDWNPLPAIAWKTSSARRHTIRLAREATALVTGGYLALLRIP